ncbi:ABC transporter permease [Occallatibacter savannae]|uniref:ABC transporter permease n=1 Tax=Occallatibacter savannae TaxID=1002691 RepID=UPI000D68D55E|nr:ABC transporter permease [Occallatibacter savannae]
MGFVANLVDGLRSLLRKKQTERELDEELSEFFDASVADKIKSGMTAPDARRAAVHDLGGTRNSVKHQVWSSRWESILEGLFQDIRMGFRSLLKSPGYTAIALLSLALGIGGNTAIFTLIDQVLLRNLPVRDPQQLVAFGDSVFGGVAGGIDLGDFGGYFPWDFSKQLEANPGPFQGIASYGSFSSKVSIRLPGAGSASAAVHLAPATLVSGNYFHVLDAQPLVGRTILPSDDAATGSGAVVVLSHRFWRQSLSEDPAIIGKTISINTTPFEVVGVMPEAFHGFKQELEPTDLWVPLSMQRVILQQPSMLTPHSGLFFLHVLGRLSPEAVSSKSAFAAAQNWLNQQVRSASLANEGSKIKPDRRAEINRLTVPLVRASNGVSLVRSQYGDSLKILMAVVGLVLLIACANLANFLLARSTARKHEIATRLALGSSRARIVRQSFTETLLLSLTGGALGLGVAFIATRALIASVGERNGDLTMSATPNASVIIFTLGVSIATAILFGFAPAVIASQIGNRGALNTSSRTQQAAGGRSSRLWPKALIVVQVTLSLVLLVGAGLLLRTLRNLQNQDYGFERTHLLLADFGEKLAGYQPHQLPALHQQLLERLSAIPGVRSAALAETPPVSNGAWSSNITLEGYTPAPKENMVSILNRISGNYFETAGISIVAGRPIIPADTAGSLRVAVVNETLARKFFPRDNAIGSKLTIGIDSVAGPWVIVGVARDTRSQNPRHTDPIRMTYIPLAQIDPYMPVQPSSSGTPRPAVREENLNRYASVILLRTTGDPEKVSADLRSAVASVDPNLPLTKITTIREQVSNLISNDELISTLTSIFSALALLLAAIGLYGVMSYNVAQRTPEIGVRLALGARVESVRWMVLRESLLLLAIGVALGLPLTIAGARGIQSQLFGLSASDPLTYAIAMAAIAAMTILASWLPALRASRVDPLVALRYE